MSVGGLIHLPERRHPWSRDLDGYCVDRSEQRDRACTTLGPARSLHSAIASVEKSTEYQKPANHPG
jgi:hypothetical protein